MAARAKTPATDVDPLAALREPVITTPPVSLEKTEPAEVEGDLLVGVLMDQAWHDDAVRTTVAAWHADPVAQKFAHRGGTCSCRYLAALCLKVSVGVALPEAVEGDGEREAGGKS